MSSTMSSIIRIYSCLLLVGGVASLSTNFMQSGPLLNEQIFHFKGQTAQAITPLSKLAAPQVSQWLNHLRGGTNTSSHPEHQLAANKQSLSDEDRPQPVTFMSNQLSSKMSMRRVIFVSFGVVIICLGLAALCLFVMEENEPPSSDRMPAKPPEDLYVMETCDGTWARTYQNADGQSKQGLELLFRCHIIPTEEFANSRVSQEHVDESVWIATHMLRKKPLDEWTEIWPEALREFEESVTACFAARTDVRSSFYDGVPGSGSRQGSPRALQFLDSLVEQPTNFGKQPPSDPIAGSGGSGLRDEDIAQSSGAQTKTPIKGATPIKMPGDSKPDALPLLKTPQDRKSLMERCRQIMAASDAQKKPLNAKSGASSEASSPPKKAGNR